MSSEAPGRVGVGQRACDARIDVAERQPAALSYACVVAIVREYAYAMRGGVLVGKVIKTRIREQEQEQRRVKTAY